MKKLVSYSTPWTHVKTGYVYINMPAEAKILGCEQTLYPKITIFAEIDTEVVKFQERVFYITRTSEFLPENDTVGWRLLNCWLGANGIGYFIYTKII